MQEYSEKTAGVAATVTSAAQDVASSVAETAATAAGKAQEMAFQQHRLVHLECPSRRAAGLRPLGEPDTAGSHRSPDNVPLQSLKLPEPRA